MNVRNILCQWKYIEMRVLIQKWFYSNTVALGNAYNQLLSLMVAHMCGKEKCQNRQFEKVNEWRKMVALHRHIWVKSLLNKNSYFYESSVTLDPTFINLIFFKALHLRLYFYYIFTGPSDIFKFDCLYGVKFNGEIDIIQFILTQCVLYSFS